MHAAVERGRSHALLLGPGQQADGTRAAELLAAVPRPRYVLADKDYDTNAVVEQVALLGAEVVIPSKKNRTCRRLIDRDRYRQRNRVERFFGRLKDFRRLATRYEKTPPPSSASFTFLPPCAGADICPYALELKANVAVAGASRLKAPSALVVPFTTMVTPGKPCSVAEFVLLPVTVRFCASTWCTIMDTTVVAQLD